MVKGSLSVRPELQTRLPNINTMFELVISLHNYQETVQTRLEKQHSSRYQSSLCLCHSFTVAAPRRRLSARALQRPLARSDNSRLGAASTHGSVTESCSHPLGPVVNLSGSAQTSMGTQTKVAETKERNTMKWLFKTQRNTRLSFKCTITLVTPCLVLFIRNPRAPTFQNNPPKVKTISHNLVNTKMSSRT